MKTRVIVALAVLAFAAVARAEIYEWRDASGTRHFTNNRESVPSEHRDALQVVVAELPSPPSVAAPQVAAEPAPVEAQVVYDEQTVRRAYQAGLRDGLDYRAEMGSITPSVQINGPLAVAGAHAVDASNAVPFTYEPFVTSSFDRGRSRHLTLRMLLQDQFQLDRDGPFLHERLPTGAGPSFRVFLPRGLNERVPAGNRVRYR